jgi:hypothetical protein
LAIGLISRAEARHLREYSAGTPLPSLGGCLLDWVHRKDDPNLVDCPIRHPRRGPQQLHETERWGSRFAAAALAVIALAFARRCLAFGVVPVLVLGACGRHG